MSLPRSAPAWSAAGAAALAFVSLGCGMAMDQGTLQARNADDAQELNAPLAVGASLQPSVQMDLKGSASPTLRLASGRPEVVLAEGGRLTGRAPGVSAILVTTKEGVVLDFYHLWVEQATRATLHRLYDDGRNMGEVTEGIDLRVGESVTLTPRVYHDSQELAGTVPAQWRVEPPVAAVLREGVGDRRRVVAGAEGEARLTVQLANVTVVVPIRVVAASVVAARTSAGDEPSRSTEQPSKAEVSP